MGTYSAEPKILQQFVLPATEQSIPMTTGTPVQIWDSSISGRTPKNEVSVVIIENDGANPVYIGSSSVTSTARVRKLLSGSFVAFEIIDEGLKNIYALGTTGDNISVAQLG